MVHDPHHVAQLAALLLSSHGNPEKHHVKSAVAAAKSVLDEAFLQAEEDEKTAADKAAEVEPAVEVAPVADKA